MTKHHHTGHRSDPHQLLTAIETFLSNCRKPALLEYGDELLPLASGNYALEIHSGRVWIEAWYENRSVSRRILEIEKASSGVLDCLIHRFAGQPGKLTFLDIEKPQTAHRQLSGRRGSFAEQFRRMLARQFPGWNLDTVTTGMDLQRSLSPVYPRARLIRGSLHIAAMACPTGEAESGMLTFALLWFDHVRRASQRAQLCLFLPDASGALTAQRLRWLTTGPYAPRLFRYNEHGSAGEVDPQDLGNIETRVSARFQPAPSNPEVLNKLQSITDLGSVPELNGDLSLRIRGVEFARLSKDKLSLGLETLVPATEDEVSSFASHFSALLVAASAAPSHAPVPSANERWLESVLRRDPLCIHPQLRPDLLHGQVLTFSGIDRDRIDLLGVTQVGQLALIELKADEDLHLAIQALDYWMRIGHHADRGELSHLFPGVPLRTDRALLYLIAPALAFHPATEIVLRYFSPEIHVERLGVNANWRQGAKIVMRLLGASSPQSHVEYEHPHRHL